MRSATVHARSLHRAMRALALALACVIALCSCATTDSATLAPRIPADAVASERVLDNGDVITEYRVAGQLHVVKVKPLRGPAYYLQDRNGDGRVDGDNVSPVYFKLFEW